MRSLLRCFAPFLRKCAALFQVMTDLFDKREVEGLLRAAAVAGVGMWEAVTVALAKLCKELLSESVDPCDAAILLCLAPK